MRPEETVPGLIEHPKGSIAVWTIIEVSRQYELHVQFACVRFENMERFGTIAKDYGKGVVILSPLVWYAKTPAELESILPMDAIRTEKMPADPDSTVGVWIEHKR